MMNTFEQYHPVLQAFPATCFTWSLTALGAAIVIVSQPILPYALAFAAGAMIFVVAEEVIPQSQQGGNADLATMGLMAGFTLMMTLDVALG